MEFFDSHAHYNDERFLKNRDSLIKEMYDNGITGIVCAGYSYDSSADAVKFVQKYPHMYATCGISPNDISENVDREIENLETIAKNKKVVAIGEIGLDYYWNKDNKETQIEVFKKQIELANRLDLPIVIHTREATVDTINVLKECTPIKRGVFHCCPLNQELIKEGLKLGFYISFSGNITFKNAKSDGCVNLVPMDKLLIETDSPYLSPEPLRGTTNTSENVKLVAKKIAEIKQLLLEEVSKTTAENAKRLFGLFY